MMTHPYGAKTTTEMLRLIEDTAQAFCLNVCADLDQPTQVGFAAEILANLALLHDDVEQRGVGGERAS
jgi:hypothetical protein